MLAELVQKKQVRYVSFDIFDTAVLRSTEKPTDVFNIVARQFERRHGPLNFDFHNARIGAEKTARQRAWHEHRETEVTLDSIYECLAESENFLHKDHRRLRRLKDLELEIELRVSLPNPYIRRIYELAKKSGKDVLFISDIYLPLASIQKILLKCGYTYKHLFISSEYRKTKSFGDLYEKVISCLNCSPETILHIGDNLQSDVKMARKYKIIGKHYRKCRELAFNDQWFKRNTAIPLRQYDNLERSLVIGTQIAKFFPFRDSAEQCMRYEKETDFWYRLGYCQVGLLFLGLSLWLIKTSEKDDRQALFFLSRDGYIMKKAYDLLSEHTGKRLPSYYMYASRRALNLPSIVEMDDDVLDFLIGGTSTLTVAQFLSRIGFDPKEFSSLSKRAGLHGLNEQILSGRDYACLRKLFLLMKDNIMAKAAQERKILREYLVQNCLFNYKKIGIVDIGWHGSLQNSLENLMKIFGMHDRIDIMGYYLGTWAKAKDFEKKGRKMRSYLCHHGRPETNHAILKLCVEFFEFLFSAPHGSVIGFQKMDGEITPVFDQNDMDSNKLAKAEKVQQGALDFLEDLVRGHSVELLDIPAEITLSPLGRLLKKPTLKEAEMLGDLQHAEGFGDVYQTRYLARPSCLAYINPLRLAREYKEAFWRCGYLKRFFRIISPC